MHPVLVPKGDLEDNDAWMMIDDLLRVESMRSNVLKHCVQTFWCGGYLE